MGMWDRAATVVLTLALAAPACGRIGFSAREGGPTIDASMADADAKPSGPVMWVQNFVAQASLTPTPTPTWIAQARAAGDAVVVTVGCDNGTQPTGAQVTATGWSFTSLGPIVGSGASGWVTTFGAIAPDTVQTQFSVQWNVSGGCNGHVMMGDEFIAATFGAHDVAFAAGDCLPMVTTTKANSTLWVACVAAGGVVGPTAGFTRTGDDGSDLTEVRVTTDPAGMAEAIDVAINSGPTWASAIELAIP
jgi:hypothetical protein